MRRDVRQLEKKKKEALNNSLHGVTWISNTRPSEQLVKKKNRRLISPYGASFIQSKREIRFTHNDIISHHVPLGWSCTAGPSQHRNISQPSFTAAPSERRERTDEVRESP